MFHRHSGSYKSKGSEFAGRQTRITTFAQDPKKPTHGKTNQNSKNTANCQRAQESLLLDLISNPQPIIAPPLPPSPPKPSQPIPTVKKEKTLARKRELIDLCSDEDDVVVKEECPVCGEFILAEEMEAHVKSDLEKMDKKEELVGIPQETKAVQESGGKDRVNARSLHSIMNIRNLESTTTPRVYAMPDDPAPYRRRSSTVQSEDTPLENNRRKFRRRGRARRRRGSFPRRNRGDDVASADRANRRGNPSMDGGDDGTPYDDADALGIDFAGGATWEGIGCMGLGDDGFGDF